MDLWWNNRNTKTYVFNPSNSKIKAKIINDRNYQDTYSDPGSFVMKKNKYNSYVLLIKKNFVYAIGDGFSENGQYPFLDLSLIHI